MAAVGFGSLGMLGPPRPVSDTEQAGSQLGAFDRGEHATNPDATFLSGEEADGSGCLLAFA